MRPVCDCHGEAMVRKGYSRKGTPQWRCHHLNTRLRRAREQSPEGIEIARARHVSGNPKRVYVHDGPGGRITMDSAETAAAAAALVRAHKGKLRAAQAAERALA